MLPLSDREKRWGWIILAAFLLAITLPYLWAWFITPLGQTWGGLLFSADDQNVHLAWARQVQGGAFFLRDLFTTEGLVSGDRPLFFNVLALLMGWISRLTGCEVGVSYHIVRVAGAAWALWQLHLLSWSVTKGAPDRENARLWTLALAVFTTGAGLLALAVPSILSSVALIDRADNQLAWPLMPEAFFLLSALLYPLNIVSFGLLSLVFRHILDGKWWPAALGALLLSNVHTYDALPLMLIAALWAAWQWKTERVQSWRALAALGGALVPVLYQVVVFRDSQEFRIKALTLTPPPPIQYLLISFLPLLVLAIWGASALGERRRERNLLALWALATLALVYTPGHLISFARKMIEGFQLPLLVLAGAALGQLRRPVVAGALVAVLAISPLLTMNWIMENAAENNITRVNKFSMPALYLYDSEVAALGYINRDNAPGAVLCLPITGAYVPRATGKYTYAGHWAETLYMRDEKMPLMARYFNGQMSPGEARQFFARNKIHWIFEGPYERSLNPDSASQRLGLKSLFSAGEGDNRTVVYAAQ